jgi:uncharacterized membrane protein YebE (DUF533 family)
MNRTPPPPAERTLHLALAQKTLLAWAQNRQQVRVPLTLNLAQLPPDQRGLMVGLMAAALAACDAVAEPDAHRLAAALARIGAAEQEEAGRRALRDPPDLVALLNRLQAAKLGAHGFAAVSLVLDRRDPAQRLFLEWIAARFALPPSLSAGLVRRYGR